MDTATLVSALRVVHIASAILMIWPFYALVAVNQRARLGPPLGDRADVLVESVIKNRTIPCFVFHVTVLLTGLALIGLRGSGLQTLVEDPLPRHEVSVAGRAGRLAHLRSPSPSAAHRMRSSPAAAEDRSSRTSPRPSANCGSDGGAWRRCACSACSTAAMLGVQVAHPFGPGLMVLFIVAIAALTWRSYRSATPFGWF